MKVTIAFQNLEHTPSLDERIHEKTEKLAKYMDGKSQIKWNCYLKDKYHVAEVNFLGPKCDFHATAKSDSLYKTIDMVIQKLEKQITKKNGKVKNKMHRGSEKPEILDYECAWTDYDEDYVEEAS